jgi:transketolase
MLLYALLYLTGVERISLDQIKSFREFGSHCAGHPEFDIAAGIEVTTGPLGQGIGNALGMAIAEAHLNARFGDALVDHRTYAFVGDGCLQEGIGQEVISLAGHLRLRKLTFPVGRQPHHRRRRHRAVDQRGRGSAIPRRAMACGGSGRPRHRGRLPRPR